MACGAREIDELAVRPAMCGTGLAGRLLEVVASDAPKARSWLLTSVRLGRAMSFYRRHGCRKTAIPLPSGEGGLPVAWVGPHHPARTAATLPD
ncbi:GNAT family N-acetyltransferase [Streptomyces sp. NPDC050619]|uniref:GNAT family N-acetyltransferase n=1 Tax=Streptomyces sp. NPDC050619 TaxID=3157214 RepID=UPI00343477FF